VLEDGGIHNSGTLGVCGCLGYPGCIHKVRYLTIMCGEDLAERTYTQPKPPR
jgi:hypothetical protein